MSRRKKMNETKSTGSVEGQATKRKFKMPGSLTIIIGVLIGVVILTWIASWAGASYDTEVPVGEWVLGDDGWTGPTEIVNENVTPMGIFGAPIAAAYGFLNAADLIFYLFILGAVIELMLVSGSLEKGVAGLVKGFNGKEIFLIPLLVFIFSAGGTIYGMQEETIALFVIIVPALCIAGFDAITGLLVILLGTTTGFAMSTVNPFSIGAALGGVGDSVEDFSDTAIVFRLIWWFVLTIAVAAFVTGYAAFVKKNPEKSFNKEMKGDTDAWISSLSATDDSPSTGKQKAAIGVFMTSFILMVLLFIPWNDLGIIPEYTLDGPFLGIFFGNVAQLGWWYFAELSMLFIITGTIIAILVKDEIIRSGETVSGTMWNGAKEMFSVAIIIGVARSIPYVLETTGTQTWMVQGMTSGLEGMSTIGFIYMSFFIFLVLTLLIPSTSGLAGATMGIMAPLASQVGGAGSTESIMAISGMLVAFVLATGIVNMFVPTQAIVMASCASAHVSYGDAMKPTLTWAGIMVLISMVVLPSIMLFEPMIV